MTFPIFLVLLWKNRIYPLIRPPKQVNLGLTIVFVSMASLLLQIVWQCVPESVLTFSKTSIIGYSLITILRLSVALLAPFIFISEKYLISLPQMFGRNPGFGAFIISFFIGFPAMMIYTALHNLTIFALLHTEYKMPLASFFFITTDESIEARLLIMLTAVLLPILIEECFFRGLVFTAIPGKPVYRIVIPAIFYALWAMNPIDAFALFLLGLLSGFVRHATDNIGCSILMQIGMFCSYLLFSGNLALQDATTTTNAIDFDRSILYGSIIYLVIATILITYILRQLSKYSESLQLERGMVISGNVEQSPKKHIRTGFFVGLLCIIISWCIR